MIYIILATCIFLLSILAIILLIINSKIKAKIPHIKKNEQDTKKLTLNEIKEIVEFEKKTKKNEDETKKIIRKASNCSIIRPEETPTLEENKQIEHTEVESKPNEENDKIENIIEISPESDLEEKKSDIVPPEQEEERENMPAQLNEEAPHPNITEINNNNQDSEEIELSLDALIDKFLDHIQKKKVVNIDELSSKFGSNKEATVNKLRDLEAVGDTIGFVDKNGKYFSITMKELELLEKLVSKNKKMKMTELMNEFNEIIKLSSK